MCPGVAIELTHIWSHCSMTHRLTKNYLVRQWVMKNEVRVCCGDINICTVKTAYLLFGKKLMSWLIPETQGFATNYALSSKT